VKSIFGVLGSEKQDLKLSLTPHCALQINDVQQHKHTTKFKQFGKLILPKEQASLLLAIISRVKMVDRVPVQ